MAEENARMTAEERSTADAADDGSKHVAADGGATSLEGTAKGLVEPLSAPDLGNYEEFKAEVRELTGLNLDLYKEGQMKRRIGTLIGRRGEHSYVDYARRLRADSAELELFTNYLTINVTEFFRDEVFWERFDTEIAPMLVERFATEGRYLNVWCSACSTGEEAYSLAMSLSRLMPLQRLRVIATDVDERALKVAREGCYSEAAVKGVPRDLLERYFTRVEEGFAVADDLRSCVEFRRLDLLSDDFPPGCHLVTCRNVLIYFTAEAKDMIFEKYAGCIVPEGILFMGRTEQIVNWKRSPFVKLASSFYERREDYC